MQKTNLLTCADMPSFALLLACFQYPTIEWMCNTAREIEAATQPLCQRGWTSHSVLAEWLSGWSSHSGRVAEWLSVCGRLAGAATQPLSHSEWLSGWSSHSAAATQPLSHSGRAADAATQPLSHSERLSG